MEYWALIFFSLAVLALLFGLGSIANSVETISIAFFVGFCLLSVAALVRAVAEKES
jgi:uncharacterized membrane protein YtjA (UPF0391 family)